MGDISEIRGLVVMFSFIGVAVFVMSLIPSQFFQVSYGGKTVEPPEFFEAIDLEKYAETFDQCLNGSHASQPPEHFFYQNIGGHDLCFYYPIDEVGSSNVLKVQHYYLFLGWISYGFHDLEFWRENTNYGNYMEKTELNSVYSQGEPLEFTIRDNHLEMDLFFGFNSSAYSTPAEAFENNDLRIMIGVTWDQTATSMSAWDILGMLLFFQLPEIHWIVNAIIAIPLWIAIAYLSFILILRAIGAIFGGGA